MRIQVRLAAIAVAALCGTAGAAFAGGPTVPAGTLPALNRTQGAVVPQSGVCPYPLVLRGQVCKCPEADQFLFSGKCSRLNVEGHSTTTGTE